MSNRRLRHADSRQSDLHNSLERIGDLQEQLVLEGVILIGFMCQCLSAFRELSKDVQDKAIQRAIELTEESK